MSESAGGLGKRSQGARGGAAGSSGRGGRGGRGAGGGSSGGAPRGSLPEGARAHRELGADVRARCAVVTVSDRRTAASDRSGDVATALLEGAGHAVVERRIVPNEEARIARAACELLLGGAVDLLLFLGGTGVSGRDRTVEAVRGFVERELPGFGELFRMLSYQEQIGSAAMLSRALAGVHGHMLLVVLPGSSAAVELGLTRLVVPELGHVLGELGRG